MAVYVTADLHGFYNAFINALKIIGFDKWQDHLIVLGDVIDKGPDSVKLLQYIMNHPSMELLIGNHEFMMLNSVSSVGFKRCKGSDSELWLNFNDGKKTLEEYYQLPWKDRFRLLHWLRLCYVIRTIYVNGKKYCLSHSFYNPDLENKLFRSIGYDDVKNVVWTSVFDDDSNAYYDKIYKSRKDTTFITGHVPVQLVINNDYFEVYNHGDNHYIIDGGCSFGACNNIRNGILFLRLDDMKPFQIELIE